MIDYEQRRSELRAAGFKEYGRHDFFNYDALFQKAIRDENGVRYFIDLQVYFHTPKHTGYQVEVNYNDGCTFCKPAMAMRVMGFALHDSWTVADIEAWADELWTRLNPNYYERD